MGGVCKKCGETDPESGFYESNSGTCKECVRASVRANRRLKISYYRAYDRKRYRESEERQEHCRAQGRRYSPEVKAEYQRQYRSKNKEKIQARAKTRKAMLSGKIQKSPCHFCGTTEGLEAHHEDYSKPLDVFWMCRACHSKYHAIRGDFQEPTPDAPFAAEARI